MPEPRAGACAGMRGHPHAAPPTPYPLSLPNVGVHHMFGVLQGRGVGDHARGTVPEKKGGSDER